MLQTLPVEYTIMETIKVVVVLTPATVAATIEVDPKEFQCTIDSPITDYPVYSNTIPPVALTQTHILW